MKRGEWLTLKPGWVYRPALKEEGNRKPDGHEIGARPSDGGGGRYTVFNNRVDKQLRIMEILGEMMAAARSENLRYPLAADVRDICLRFH